jgi:hypothetical protein
MPIEKALKKSEIIQKMLGNAESHKDLVPIAELHKDLVPIAGPQPVAPASPSVPPPTPAKIVLPKEKAVLSIRGSISLDVTFKCSSIIKTGNLVVLVIALAYVDGLPEVSLTDTDARAFITLDNGTQTEIYFPMIKDMQYDTADSRHILFFIKEPDTDEG